MGKVTNLQTHKFCWQLPTTHLCTICSLKNRVEKNLSQKFGLLPFGSIILPLTCQTIYQICCLAKKKFPINYVTKPFVLQVFTTIASSTTTAVGSSDPHHTQLLGYFAKLNGVAAWMTSLKFIHDLFGAKASALGFSYHWQICKWATTTTEKCAQANGKGPKIKISQKNLETFSEWPIKGRWVAAVQATDAENSQFFDFAKHCAYLSIHTHEHNGVHT